jgi:hypothetical protein
MTRTKTTLILLAVASCLGGGAYALAQNGSSPASTAAGAKALSIRLAPLTRTIARGGTAEFTVRIHRRENRKRRLSVLFRRFDRRTVRLSVLSGLPPGARAYFRPTPTRKSVSTLIVNTRDAPAGRYRIRVLARSRTLRARSAADLVIASPQLSTNFTISGDLPRALEPGSAASLDLALSNPDPVEIAISSLEVRLAGLSAPLANASYPCSLQDFEVIQFSGSYGFKVPASSTRTLSELGLPPEQWPQVAMLDRPVNQNGCKGSSLSLSYAGASVGGTP